MIFRCNYGSGTLPELKIVLHSAMFVWLKGGDWILPLSRINSDWSPVDLFRFFRIKEPRWLDYLREQFNMTPDEIEFLVELADMRDRELNGVLGASRPRPQTASQGTTDIILTLS